MTPPSEARAMTHAEFVHLRVHSAYSLSEGAIKIDELIGLCTGQSMPAVAITDTGNLFGALEFALAAAKEGVQPIIGCQIAVTRDDPDETFNGNGSARANGFRRLTDALVLLVQSDAGYRNLLELVSRSYLDSVSGSATLFCSARENSASRARAILVAMSDSISNTFVTSNSRS